MTFTRMCPILFIALATSCSSSTGVKECGPEVRAASVIGRITNSDATPFANAGLYLLQVREPGRPETEVATYEVYAQSDSLRTHMTRAELQDTQNPPRVFGSFEPPAVLPLPPNLFSSSGPYTAQLPADDFRALAVSGQLVVEIQTNLAGQPLVRIPLTVIAQNDAGWFRARGEACG